VGTEDGDRGAAVDVGVAGVVGDRCGSCIESSLSLWDEPFGVPFKFCGMCRWGGRYNGGTEVVASCFGDPPDVESKDGAGDRVTEFV